MSSRRLGMSLIELLYHRDHRDSDALLLPAVQKVRRLRERRFNNMKQIGLATQNYALTTTEVAIKPTAHSPDDRVATPKTRSPTTT